MHEYLRTAQSIALEAGAIMTEHFGVGLRHTLKEDRSPLTEADMKVQRMVTERLAAAYPDHSLYGEEGQQLQEGPFVWVFDPIDGTAAYLRGIPTNVFSLALVRDGTPVLGVVCDPYLKRMYHAVAGEGAFLNDEPVSTSQNTEFAQSYVETDGHRGFKNLDFLEKGRAENIRFLSYSSTVYANMLVAAGQLEGVVFPGKCPWDCAAAKVIIEEAGGVTSDLYGNPQRYDGLTNGFVSAGNAEYHAKLLALIASSL